MKIGYEISTKFKSFHSGEGGVRGTINIFGIPLYPPFPKGDLGHLIWNYIYGSKIPPSQEGGQRGMLSSFSIPLTPPSPRGTFKGKPCFILTQSLNGRMDNRSPLSIDIVEEKSPPNPLSLEGGTKGGCYES